MQAPREWYEPLILPGILTFAGIIVWFLAWNGERQGKRVTWKWVGYLLIALGAFFGFQPFQAVQDYVYARQFVGERKKLYAHYLALFLPLAAIAALAGWQAVSSVIRKRKPLSE